jgi:hypothetical protein
VRVYTCMRANMCVCVCACMCVYMYVFEIFALLECYAAKIGSYSKTFPDKLRVGLLDS